MAFAIRDLSVLAYANGFTLWHYKAGNDSLSNVASDNYFGDGWLLAVGDMVMISSNSGGKLLVVTSVNDANVTTSSLV